MSHNLKMTPLMRRYYDNWLNSPTLLESPRDADKFYLFVKACIRLARIPRSGSWLRHYLNDDLKGKYSKEHTEFLINEAVSIFDHIIDFHRVVYPDHMVERRNPVFIKSIMRSVKKADGTRFYTDQDISTFIKEDVEAIPVTSNNCIGSA